MSVTRRVAGLAAGLGAVAGLTLAGAATAQASARAATPRPQVTAVNLHRAYEQALARSRIGKIAGITYSLARRPAAAPASRTASCAEPNCPLAYNGGPVQRDPRVYLLFWGPNWLSDSSQEASAAYLENFYAGLGVQPQDHWSPVTSQYGDGSGVPAFGGSVYEGAFQDTSTPPAGATATQIGAEADTFASGHGITDLGDAQIVVATQSGTCPQGFACPGDSTGYCAWHSDVTGTGGAVPFTNLPYLLDAGGNCGENFINPGGGGSHDGLSIVGGHEYAESITDPLPATGWIDLSDNVSGGEIADKCAWGGEPFGVFDPAGDVTLLTGSFAMQSLWSNTAGGCVMAPAAAPVTGLTVTAKYTNLSATWKASRGATGYQVTVTTHKGTVTVASAMVTGTSYGAGHLKENTSYAIHVQAVPAAPGQKPATGYVTTK